jgi:hypothetical protein
VRLDALCRVSSLMSVRYGDADGLALTSEADDVDASVSRNEHLD